MKRHILVSVAVASLVLLSGCSAMGSSSSSSSADSPAAPADGSTSSLGGTAESGSASAPDGSARTATLPNAQVVTTGSMVVTSDDPLAAGEKAIALVTAAGGRVDSRTERSGTDGAVATDVTVGSNSPGVGVGVTGSSGDTAAPGASSRAMSTSTLVLRVPSDAMSDTVDALKELGTVNSLDLTSDDVTTQVQDVNGRITALQASVTRLLDLLSRATTTADLVSLENTLSERQSDLDSLVAQRDALADQVQYSSMTLTLVGPGVLPVRGPSDFWSGLGAGWASFTVAAGGALVVFGLALPWIVALAICGALVLALIRFSARRGLARAARAAQVAVPSE